MYHTFCSNVLNLLLSSICEFRQVFLESCMSSEIFTAPVSNEVLASFCSCFKSSKVSYIIEFGNSVTRFQYLIIPVRVIKGTIKVLLVSLCTAQFDVLELTQGYVLRRRSNTGCLESFYIVFLIENQQVRNFQKIRSATYFTIICTYR